MKLLVIDVGNTSTVVGLWNDGKVSCVTHFDGRRPSPERCEAFAAILRRRGLNATLRRSKGSSVAAACGQLRLEKGTAP